MHWRPRPLIPATTRSRRRSSLMAAGLYRDRTSITAIRYLLTRRCGGDWSVARAWREVRFGEALIAGHLEARRLARNALKRRRPELFPPLRTPAEVAARDAWRETAARISATVRRKEFERDAQSL